ncbi:preprotein translocase subunit SecE [Fervidicella metallireducens]|nr:preprotein translocase subunit SecE [Fervidicella metallireducens]
MAAEAKIENAKPAFAMAKYFRDVKAEFKKITWPSRDNVVKTTGTVLGVMAFFTVIIWLYDLIFSNALMAILRLF